MNQDKHYFAFISHSSKDEKIALWLRNKLDNYHIPTTVQKEFGTPKRLKPCFTFQTNLARDPVLRKSLEKELDDSQFLIVVCSPNSAKPSCIDGEVKHYVNDEVQHFINTGRADKIVPFIIEGTPHADNTDEECFCPALLSLKGDDELRGVNLKKTEKHLDSKMAAVVNVIASMLGVHFDVLWDIYRRRRIIKTILLTTFVLLLTLMGVFLYEFYRTKNVYYLDYVEGNYIQNEQTEWFRGLFELSEKDVQKEVESYRFEYKRIPIGQPQSGRWQLAKVIHINSNGYPSKIENQTSPFVRYPISEIKYLYIDSVYRPEKIECFNEYGVLQRIIYVSGENLENIDYKDNRTNIGYNKPSMSQFYNPLYEHSGNKYCNISHLDIKRDSKGYVREVLFKSSNSKEDSPFVDSRGSCGMSIYRDSLGRITTIQYLTPWVTRNDNGKMAYEYFENRVYNGKVLSDIYVGNLKFDYNGKNKGESQWTYWTSFRYNDTSVATRSFRVFCRQDSSLAMRVKDTRNIAIRTICYQDSTGVLNSVNYNVNGQIVQKSGFCFRILVNQSYFRKKSLFKQFDYNKNGTIACAYLLDTTTAKVMSTIHYLYDSKRLPIKEIHEGVIDACDNYIVDYEYDRYNRISQMSYSGLNNKNVYQVRYTYDKNGRVCAESYYDDLGKLSDCCTFSMTNPTDDFEKHVLEYVSFADNDNAPDTLWQCGIAYPVYAKYARRTFQYDNYGNVDAIRYYRSNDTCFFMINENIQDNGLVRRSVAYVINYNNDPKNQYLIVCNSCFGDDFEFTFEMLEGMPLDSMKWDETIVPKEESVKEQAEILKFNLSDFKPCEGKGGRWVGNGIIQENGRKVRSDYVYVNDSSSYYSLFD